MKLNLDWAARKYSKLGTLPCCPAEADESFGLYVPLPTCSEHLCYKDCEGLQIIRVLLCRCAVKAGETRGMARLIGGSGAATLLLGCARAHLMRRAALASCHLTRRRPRLPWQALAGACSGAGLSRRGLGRRVSTRGS